MFQFYISLIMLLKLKGLYKPLKTVPTVNLSHTQLLFERYNAFDINNMYRKELCVFMYKSQSLASKFFSFYIQKSSKQS